MFFAYKKYFQMAGIALIGISIWLLLKKDPSKCKNLLLYANNMVKYMPIDKGSMNMISPILDFTQKEGGFMYQMNRQEQQERKIMESGHPSSPYVIGVGGGVSGGVSGVGVKTTKRSVSETKKKYVASQQNWKCGKCNKQLNAWFEVDHKVRLEYGGGNQVENLVALCRECHGRKTAMENM